jgi:Fic family protein
MASILGDAMPVYTGEYFEHPTDGASRGIYYSFLPKHLVDGSFYTADEELFSLLIEAHRALGILEGMVVNMPDSDVLLESAALKECHYSRLIDYPDVSMYSLLESRGGGEDISVVQNIISAYEKAFDENIDIDRLCEIHGIANDGLDFNRQKGLRKTPFYLTGTVTNLKRYNPTAPEHIFPALKDIFLYLQQSTSDALIKAAMVHYQFEMVHPFENYNGIVGRILASKAMMDGGLRAAPYLSLSELLYESKNDYFDLLSSTQKGGGYVRWIKFFAGVLCVAARHRVKQIESYRQLVKRDEEKIRQAQPVRMHNVLTVFEYWKHYIVSNIKQPVEKLQLSYSAVARAIAVLSELKILKQITDTPRYRKYTYPELMNLFIESPVGFAQAESLKQSAAKTGRT